MKHDIPRTMTLAGLSFLQALAAQRRSGCFLEIGPLFGSSTGAIDAGRADRTVPIHTIDTFEAAPWVRKRLGQDLSRNAFEKYTQHIENLHIHQGFAPDTVKDHWSAPIGFYFDDATHGDPGWTDNFTFFEPFFTEDAILCGDDFASGWPDIVRNVTHLADVMGARLFVVGRVWAFTRIAEHRIETAIHSAFPRLRDYRLAVRHGERADDNIAASWSRGLHKTEPLTEIRIFGPDGLRVDLSATYLDGTQNSANLLEAPLPLTGLRSLKLSLSRGILAQFCIGDRTGKTGNTKDLPSGTNLTLKDGEVITAMRLSHRPI